MKPVDRFLLGIDLVKDKRVLEAAYNDSRGVTAAFNKNVLRVLKRELDGSIDEAAFEHLAFYDSERERIEMHLVSSRRQRFSLRAIDLRFDLARGERIMTEISRKFTPASIADTLCQSGLALEEWITDERETFALAALRIARDLRLVVIGRPCRLDCGAYGRYRARRRRCVRSPRHTEPTSRTRQPATG